MGVLRVKRLSTAYIQHGSFSAHLHKHIYIHCHSSSRLLHKLTPNAKPSWRSKEHGPPWILSYRAISTQRTLSPKTTRMKLCRLQCLHPRELSSRLFLVIVGLFSPQISTRRTIGAVAMDGLQPRRYYESFNCCYDCCHSCRYK